MAIRNDVRDSRLPPRFQLRPGAVFIYAGGFSTEVRMAGVMLVADAGHPKSTSTIRDVDIVLDGQYAGQAHVVSKPMEDRLVTLCDLDVTRAKSQEALLAGSDMLYKATNPAARGEILVKMGADAAQLAVDLAAGFGPFQRYREPTAVGSAADVIQSIVGSSG